MKALLYLFSGTALAQTLAPVTAPVSDGLPWMWIILAGFVLAAVGYVVWRHGHATAAAKVEAGASQVSATASADVHAVASALGRWAGAVESRLGTTLPPVDPAVASPTVVAGKSGQSGTFTIQVSGESTQDLQAIIAQYNAK